MFQIDPRLQTLAYEPQNFRDVAETQYGQALWDFLRRSDNVVRMETATYLERAAVEPLGPVLVVEFGHEVEDERTKQTIGHMTRQVMEALGYAMDRPGLRIGREGLFTSGARYRDKTDKRNKAMRITPEQRRAWLETTEKSPFNQWLNAQVRDSSGALDLNRLYTVAETYGVSGKREAYAKLNPGQQRMNIGVQLRRVVPTEVYGSTEAQ